MEFSDKHNRNVYKKKIITKKRNHQNNPIILNIEKSMIKCTYEIKDHNQTQIINDSFEDLKNEDIESKIKIWSYDEKEKLVYKKKFSILGINVVYFVIEEKLKDMSFMFNNCSSLKKIEFISFSTDEVTNMKALFQGCTELEEIDLSNFNTINVTNMRNMFNGCKKLKQIKGFINLDTTKVIDMRVCSKIVMN